MLLAACGASFGLCGIESKNILHQVKGKVAPVLN
jgi:hypothetical protein